MDTEHANRRGFIRCRDHQIMMKGAPLFRLGELAKLVYAKNI